MLTTTLISVTTLGGNDKKVGVLFGGITSELQSVQLICQVMMTPCASISPPVTSTLLSNRPFQRFTNSP
jgi:hypothetical protein